MCKVYKIHPVYKSNVNHKIPKNFCFQNIVVGDNRGHFAKVIKYSLYQLYDIQTK